MSFSAILSDRDVLNNRNILTLMYAYDDRDTVISIDLIKYVIWPYEMAKIESVGFCTICISCLSHLFKRKHQMLAY